MKLLLTDETAEKAIRRNLLTKKAIGNPSPSIFSS